MVGLDLAVTEGPVGMDLAQDLAEDPVAMMIPVKSISLEATA